MKQIPDYNWTCTWTSHMGCLKAGAEKLGLEHTLSWIFGGTGHAFIINIHPTGCSSGPTAWGTERLFKLGNNLGYHITGICTSKRKPGFESLQSKAFSHIKHALDKGLPCYGWELDIPEFYCIAGYDEVGYYYSGPTAPKTTGPKRWSDLGDTDIGLLEVYSMERCTGASDALVVKEALEFALEHAAAPAKWIYPGYTSGLQAYDVWLAAVDLEKPDLLGLGYNAAVWHECRNYAVQFLKEASERLDSHELFADAINYYENVEGHLSNLKELYPFPPDPARLRDKDDAIAALRKAKEEETRGLDALRILCGAL